MNMNNEQDKTSWRSMKATGNPMDDGAVCQPDRLASNGIDGTQDACDLDAACGRGISTSFCSGVDACLTITYACEPKAA
jgi:hypothetical protein